MDTGKFNNIFITIKRDYRDDVNAMKQQLQEGYRCRRNIRPAGFNARCVVGNLTESMHLRILVGDCLMVCTLSASLNENLMNYINTEL